MEIRNATQMYWNLITVLRNQTYHSDYRGSCVYTGVGLGTRTTKWGEIDNLMLEHFMNKIVALAVFIVPTIKMKSSCSILYFQHSY